MTILNYYGKLKMIWEELGNYEQYPTCQCGKCSCDISRAWDKKRDEEKLHQFLMGLDDTVYGGVCLHILSTKPLPNLNRAYAIVVQEEQVRTMTHAKEEKAEAVAFAAHTGKRQSEDRDKNTICTHCNKTDHDVESCFQLINYPEWWGDRPKNNTRGTGRGRGGQKQRTGAGGKGCDSQAKANTTKASAQGNTSQGESVDAAKTGLNGLSSEQWNMLLNLLNTQKEGSQRLSGKQKLSEWIIDTKASHHMTGNLESMRDIKNIIPCSVGLPDGKATIAEKEGTIALDDHLKLTSVLYVPSLNCKLLSVSQLIEESNYIVQFTNKFCVIQDRTTRMLIGAGEQREGLYYFQSIASTRAMKTIECRTSDIWHQRQFNKPVKVIRIDNGTEFVCLAGYFVESGIIHQTTCVGTSQQNGRVERKHHHILNVARALRF
ncbi:PREDICTED: uncharacterized protein LOC104597773 [Nelumbo nucifera]|uniref:Uncharacterized protein LOC104597773 n=1 Tax=Nelumbo nucifera TaxID=4432 RepID=A0A1U7ZVT0_NELNU|nr:PREDICTED: uncharacterized protein LOC104597773 [Nelumbo nucifera]